MKKYINLGRLFEQETVSSNDFNELGMQPETGEYSQPTENQPLLPSPEQTSAPADPMSMTVRDFITKCKEIDPLVCMGIESFIQKNTASFSQGHTMSQEPSQDLTFSNVVEPAQDDLSFSNVVAPEMSTPPAPAHQYQAPQNFPSN